MVHCVHGDAVGPTAGTREGICVTAWDETVPRAAVAHTVPWVGPAAGAVGEAEEPAWAPHCAPLLPAVPGLSAMFPILPWCQRPSATTSS